MGMCGWITVKSKITGEEIKELKGQNIESILYINVTQNARPRQPNELVPDYKSTYWLTDCFLHQKVLLQKKSAELNDIGDLNSGTSSL